MKKAKTLESYDRLEEGIKKWWNETPIRFKAAEIGFIGGGFTKIGDSMFHPNELLEFSEIGGYAATCAFFMYGAGIVYTLGKSLYDGVKEDRERERDLST